jgi:hypothetical protein
VNERRIVTVKHDDPAPPPRKLTIAEIIGKVTRLRVGGFVPHPYTVDDLLAWLTSRPAFSWSSEFSGPITIFGGPGGYTVVLQDREGDDDGWMAPTLLAALEAAVRAVAEVPE